MSKHDKDKKKKKKKRGSHLAKILYAVSDELRAVIKEKKISRPALSTAIWDYIKKHKLQDKDDKRVIRADKDERLAAVLGKKPINMLKMTSKLSDHLTRIE